MSSDLKPVSEAAQTKTDKAALRIVARERRRAARQAASGTAGAVLRDHVINAAFMSGGGPVSAYWPVRDEIDTRPLLEDLAKAGVVCALPVIVSAGQPLIFRAWRPGMEMIDGGFAVETPGDDSPEVTPRVVLTPLLAFDFAGYRLGYGGGYYDRTLAELRRRVDGVVACGLAFEGQAVPAVPRDAYDQPLDWMATEKGVRRCPFPAMDLPEGAAR